MTATDIFYEAVRQIESKSIKAWATMPGNKQAWIKHIEGLLEKKKPIDTGMLAAYMVAVAMG